MAPLACQIRPVAPSADMNAGRPWRHTAQATRGYAVTFLVSRPVLRVGEALCLVLDVDGNLGERLGVFPAVVGTEEQLT